MVEKLWVKCDALCAGNAIVVAASEVSALLHSVGLYHVGGLGYWLGEGEGGQGRLSAAWVRLCMSRLREREIPWSRQCR